MREVGFIRKRGNLEYSLVALFFLSLFVINITSVSDMNADYRYTISYIIIVFSLVFYISLLLIKNNYKLIPDKKTLLILFLILAFGFLLRVYNLTDGGIHMDELWRLNRGRQVTLFHDWSYMLSASPLTRILVGTFSLLGGTDPLSIEFYTRFFLGTITSTLTILIVFFIGNRISNVKVGLLSAFFLAFSFEHLRLSRTFMSEPYLTLFVALTILSFFMSLEKPRYIYLTSISLVLVILTKMTGLALVPFVILGYAYYTYKRKFTAKQMFLASITSLFLFIYLQPFLISTGNFIGLFFGPVENAKVLYEACQPTPWLYHFKYLFTYDKILFSGAILTFIIAIYKKEDKPLLLFFAGISMIMLITFITHKGNMLFHRHITTCIPPFAVMAGYASFQLYEVIKKYRKKMAVIVLLIILTLQPISLYLHNDKKCSDEGWMHYNANVKGTDVKQIGLDLRQTSDVGEDIALYFFSSYETTIYGPLINYYYVGDFTTLDNLKPKLKYLPQDMYDNASKFAKVNGINYLIYKVNPNIYFNTSDFDVIKKYPDNVAIMKYLGSHIYFGYQSTTPLDNPFEVIDKNVYENKTYIWIEAEDETHSYGKGFRPYGTERSVGIYGTASNGHLHFVKNTGSYSSYSVNLEKSGNYNIWIRLGAYSPVGVMVNNNTFVVSPTSSQFQWYAIGPIHLDSKTKDIKIVALDESYSIYDALLITDDLNYVPKCIYKPKYAWGRPTNDVECGYIIWQDESGWHIRWHSDAGKNFTGKIIAFDKIDVFNYIANSSDKMVFNGTDIYFELYNQNGIDGGIDFNTESEYVKFDLN